MCLFFVLFFVCLFVCIFCIFDKSRRTVAFERVQGVMSKEEASSIRFRLILDFSKWGRMRMPTGGIFDSDLSCNLSEDLYNIFS